MKCRSSCTNFKGKEDGETFNYRQGKLVGRSYCSLSNEFSTEGLVLVQTECFKNQNLSFFTSPVLTMRVIIYFVNILDSIGNYIFINVTGLPVTCATPCA